MWQEIIVGVCVLAAGFFLLRRWLPVGKKKAAGCDSGCGGCASTKACGTNSEAKHSPDDKGRGI
jgi:hypothetical protein